MEDKRRNWILYLFIILFLALLTMTKSRAGGTEAYSAWAVGSLGLDARSVALGGAMTAAPPEWNGWDHNPASLTQIGGSRIYAGSLDWANGASMSQAGALIPARGAGVLALAIRHFDQGAGDAALYGAAPGGEALGARDLRIASIWSQRLSGRLLMGARLDLMQRSLGAYSGEAIHLSLGVISDEMRGFRFAASLLGIGSSMILDGREVPPPEDLKLGLSHRMALPAGLRLIQLLDAMPAEDSWGYGAEAALRQRYYGRAGYRFDYGAERVKRARRVSFGGGLRIGSYRLDYAWSAREDFDSAHRLSLHFDFPVKDEVPVDAGRRLAEMSQPWDDPNFRQGAFPALARVTVLSRINFETSSAELDAASLADLGDLYQRLQNTPNVVAVEIQGHADDRGDKRSNDILSIRRARAVRDYLVAQGYPARKIGVMAFGASEPMGDNKTDAGRAANRRIEIHLIKENGTVY